MTNVSRNLVNDVLQCIKHCSEKQEELKRMPARNDEALRIRALDMLKDIEINLCNLAACFVTAPMSGRLFIPLPCEYVDEATAQQSRAAQLRS
jgi:hypothetical protein